MELPSFEALSNRQTDQSENVPPPSAWLLDCFLLDYSKFSCRELSKQIQVLLIPLLLYTHQKKLENLEKIYFDSSVPFRSGLHTDGSWESK